MKTAVLGAEPPAVDPISPAWSARRERAADFVALTKPRIAVMVLITVAVGFLLGDRGASTTAALPRGLDASRLAALLRGLEVPPWPFLLTMVGTGLVAAGASAWNQVIERPRDARMRRTADRPLPSGRLAPAEAAWFGSALAVLGLALLGLGSNAVAVAVAAATFVLYAFVYTPLKPITTLNTAVGAVPGALPPVIGWAAATGRLGVEAWALFLIVFLWQFPHFLAIAWIHRADYARAGHKMLPTVDPAGAITGRQAAGYALALVPAGLLPAVVGLAGPWYFAGSLALGLFYLVGAVRFWADVSDATARKLLGASFLYLPAVLLILVLNPLPA